jgi:tetratricopeptide (TPR) repeat protein
LDLKQLNNIDLIRNQQTVKRTKNAESLIELGLSQLTLLFKNCHPLERKKILLETFDFFTQSLSAQRSHPNSYIGIAFILILIGKPVKALSYIKEAQRLAPNHPDIQILLEMIQRIPKQGVASPTTQQRLQPSFSPREDQLEEIDFDNLYDQLEAMIITEVRLMLQDAGSQPKPSCEEKELKGLERRLSALRQKYQTICEQLKILEIEFDTCELEGQLKPFKVSLDRIKQVVIVSQDLIQLKKKIQEQNQLTLVLIDEVKSNLEIEDVPVVQENIEILLDQCDLYADKLDESEEKKYPVQALILHYQDLVGHVETLQEEFDEMRERFKI